MKLGVIFAFLLLCAPAFGATVYVSQSGGSISCGKDGTQTTTALGSVTWTTGSGIDPAMGGTLTGTSIAMIVEYTY